MDLASYTSTQMALIMVPEITLHGAIRMYTALHNIIHLAVTVVLDLLNT